MHCYFGTTAMKKVTVADLCNNFISMFTTNNNNIDKDHVNN